MNPEQCKTCVHESTSRNVHYGELTALGHMVLTKNCWLENYNEDTDSCECGNYEAFTLCKWCGAPTRNKGTKQCDRCWELSHRIESDPELAYKMLDNTPCGHPGERILSLQKRMLKKHKALQAADQALRMIYETLGKDYDKSAIGVILTDAIEA